MTSRFEAAGSEAIRASMLPHYDAVKDFYHAELQAPHLSSDGDIVMYIPLLGVLLDFYTIRRSQKLRHFSAEFLRPAKAH